MLEIQIWGQVWIHSVIIHLGNNKSSQTQSRQQVEFAVNKNSPNNNFT